MYLLFLCLYCCCCQWRSYSYWCLSHSWWGWWSAGARYVYGSLCLPWSGSSSHSAGTETQASHRQKTLFHNVAGDTGSPSDWKSGLNNPVYIHVCVYVWEWMRVCAQKVWKMVWQQWQEMRQDEHLAISKEGRKCLLKWTILLDLVNHFML